MVGSNGGGGDGRGGSGGGGDGNNGDGGVGSACGGGDNDSGSGGGGGIGYGYRVVERVEWIAREEDREGGKEVGKEDDNEVVEWDELEEWEGEKVVDGREKEKTLLE